MDIQSKSKMFLMVIFAMLCVPPLSYAGSDRIIMAMTPENMNKTNLVYVRFFGPNGSVLESDELKIMEVREQDCSAGHLFLMSKDYRIGYSPKKMLVGLYLSPYMWRKKKLCFSVPYDGKIEQSFDPAANKSRLFELKLVK